MKIRDGMILSEVGGAFVAVAVGKTAQQFHGLVRLNESGANIWKKLEAGLNLEEIATKLTEEYSNLTLTEAKVAIKDVVDKLAAAGLLED